MAPFFVLFASPLEKECAAGTPHPPPSPASSRPFVLVEDVAELKVAIGVASEQATASSFLSR